METEEEIKDSPFGNIVPDGSTTAPSTSTGEVKKVVTKGPITIDSVKKSQYDKPGFMQATLRQVITTKSSYPTVRVGNSMADSIFDLKEFAGAEDRIYESTETRIAWMDVPEGFSIANVKDRLATFPDATIYRVLSNAPILTKEQISSIERGLKTMDDYATTQAVRYPANFMKDGVDVSNQLILDTNHHVQYKVNYFKKDKAEDQDRRTTNTDLHYVSPELEAELKGAAVIEGQRL